jgi:ABC-2 type transport system ATP-binding protein
MDEAERCHKIAYIAWGRLLAQGTAAQLIDSLGLATWTVQAENLTALADRLRGRPGVAQTVAFGNALHVSGTQAEALRSTLEALGRETGAQVRPIPTSLEDAFIHLMKDAAPEDGSQQGAR